MSVRCHLESRSIEGTLKPKFHYRIEGNLPRWTEFKIKIYADGANPSLIEQYASEAYIAGFTTNPTLMRSSGIVDYESFAKSLLVKIPHKPFSFEVFSDEMDEMRRQALLIASWGKNIFVKVPITNSRGESTVEVIRYLASEGVQVNVTALLTVAQVQAADAVLNPKVPAILSLFAGRIADTGRDAVDVMRKCRQSLSKTSTAQLLWASSRELYNLVQAEESGADIITMSPDLLKKLPMMGKDLTELSLDTVKMFKKDAEAAGYRL